MEERLRAALKSIQGVKIPDFPKEIVELDEELSSKFPNNQDVTNIIESNTKLSGEVMRLVNSPAMKLKQPVTSIREAVDVLGYNNLKNLVVAAALQNLFSSREVQEVIDHSKDVAFCCAELSDHIEGVTRDEAYLAGLFHNAGSLMLTVKDPENYLKMFAKVNANPVSGVQKEEEIYGAPHTDIGILIGKKWQLPVEMLNVIMLHHRDTSNVANDKVRGMVAMIKVANVIVSEVSLGSYMTEEARNYMADGVEELMIDKGIVAAVRRALIAFS